jgi:hypothetical protein
MSDYFEVKININDEAYITISNHYYYGSRLWSFTGPG